MSEKMDAKILTILWLSIQIVILSYMYSKQAYELGYERGRASVYQEFAADSADGYCLADVPPHQGACYDTNRKAHGSHKK